MEIHELNTFSGTPGASDYFATDNGSDTSKISADDLFAPLNERIDNIIAGGDAPSEAEVVDARLGASELGGVQYASLGAAIRGQAELLFNDIETASNNGIVLGNLIHNEYVTTSGVITPYTNWDRTDYIDVSNYYALYITKGRAGTYNCFYDEDKVFLSSFSLINGTTTIYPPKNAKYAIISDQNTYMRQLEIQYKSKAEHNSEMAIKYPYSTEQIADETDYNTLLTLGGYTVERNASAASMVNCPVKTSHRLDILQVSQSNRIVQIVTPSNNLGRIWYRLYDSATFGAWHSVGDSGSGDDSDNVPAYYKDHIETKENEIREKISDVGFSGDSFAIVADTHWARNTQNSPSLIKHIAKYTPINRLMLMGDYYITQPTKEQAYKAMQTSIGAFKNKGMDLYIIPGNHDYNYGTVPGYPILTEAEVYGQIMTGQNSVVRSDDTCTFYFDNEQLKIRYYFTTCMYDSSCNTDSYEWIFKQMEEIPDGYKVIIFTHSGLSGSGARDHNYAQYLTGALKALRDKTTYTYNGVTFDYTNTDASPIAVFSGHHHVDYVFSDNEIACIQVTTDAYYYEDSGSYPDDEIPTINRTVDTVSEQAFDVVTIDNDNDIVYMTRVGGGYDRIVHCDATTVQTSVTLTSQLSGELTWRSSDDEVAVVSNGVVTKVGSGVCMIRATDASGTAEFWNVVA